VFGRWPGSITVQKCQPRKGLGLETISLEWGKVIAAILRLEGQNPGKRNTNSYQGDEENEVARGARGKKSFFGVV